MRKKLEEAIKRNEERKVKIEEEKERLSQLEEKLLLVKEREDEVLDVAMKNIEVEFLELARFCHEIKNLSVYKEFEYGGETCILSVFCNDDYFCPNSCNEINLFYGKGCESENGALYYNAEDDVIYNRCDAENKLLLCENWEGLKDKITDILCFEIEKDTKKELENVTREVLDKAEQLANQNSIDKDDDFDLDR